ncbi:MAG: hypothetical protein EBU46_19385, partial [Nitrosomonadaceae bacterium]|nr:hypothetical protein [Nitrosomonadaceae bacterium]
MNVALYLPQIFVLDRKIKVAAVSYLNTKPLLYGIERSEVMHDMELIVDYPSRLATRLREGSIDVALLPVASMKEIDGARVISDYGIATDGNVVSVALFSRDDGGRLIAQTLAATGGHHHQRIAPGQIG